MRKVSAISVAGVLLASLWGVALGGRIQIRSSVMNDGNYSLVEYRDTTLSGPIERIEVYRCSQPTGTYGITAAGTSVASLCGVDHLITSANRVFRNVFSRGPGPGALPVALEIREEFNVPGLGVGSWEHRIRDVDASSPSYGRIMRILIVPFGTPGYYQLTYEIRGTGVTPHTSITSPLSTTVTGINPALVDLGSSVGSLPAIDTSLPGNPLTFTANRFDSRSVAIGRFATFSATFNTSPLSKWKTNFYDYLSFGDLGLKSTHPGTNLVGPPASVNLISELLVFRAYRSDMGGGGIAFGIDLGQGTPTCGPLVPGVNDTKGNIHHLFVSGFINGIALHRLVVDKIHSDYGGIPMTLAPGSRLESCASPVVDATRANQTVAEIADAFYLFPDSMLAVGVESSQESIRSNIDFRGGLPNPSGKGTDFRITLRQPARVELVVHDIAGRVIRRIDGGNLLAGTHIIGWNGRDDTGHEVASGVYLVELRVDGRSVSAKKSVRVK